MRQSVSLLAQSSLAVTEARVISSSSRSLRAVRSATDSIRWAITPNVGRQACAGLSSAAHGRPRDPRGPCVGKSRLDLPFEQMRDMAQRQTIAIDAASSDDAGRRQRNIGMMAEGLALVHVGNMHFE